MSFTNPLSIIALSLYQAGTYNPQYRRNLQMDVNHASAMAFDEATSGGTRFDPGSLDRIASSIVSLSAAPELTVHNTDGSVHIPNGWGEERCRFVLEVLETMSPSSATRHFYIGYCDHLGYKEQGTQTVLIDRKLQFYVNSVISIVETQVMQGGALTNMSRVSRSDHYLTGQFGRNVQVGFNDYSCRPIELIDHMTAATVLNNAGSPTNITNAGSAFGSTKIKPSNAAHSRPNRYVSKVLESYSKAASEQEGGYLEEEQLLRTARGYGADSLLHAEPLFRMMDPRMVQELGYFTFGSLEVSAPMLEQVTKVFGYDGAGMMGASVAGSTEYMHGNTPETHLTAIVNASLPSLCMECLFRSVSFHVSNNNPGNVISLELIPNPLLPGETYPRPSALPLTANVDHNFQWSRFRTLFIEEIFRQMSANYVNIVDAVIFCNITGDIKISVSMNGGARYDYRNPCHCDALTSSLITNNMDRLDSLTSQFFSLTNHAGNALVERTRYDTQQPLTWGNAAPTPTDPFTAQILGPNGYPMRTAPEVKRGPIIDTVGSGRPVPVKDRWDI